MRHKVVLSTNHGATCSCGVSFTGYTRSDALMKVVDHADLMNGIEST